MKPLYAILKNPLTIWIQRTLLKIILEIKHFSKNLDVGYMSQCSNSSFGNFNTIYDNVFIKNVSLGSYTYISNNSKVSNTEIGKFSCVGPEVLIGLGVHPAKDFVSNHPIFYSSLKQSQITFSEINVFNEFPNTKVGHDVWIGARAIIIDGVKIGDGVIVGAGAIVTKDIPDYAIVGGIPAKILRYRFEPKEIEFLQKYKWWDKDINWLRENFELFHNIKKLMQITENHEKSE